MGSGGSKSASREEASPKPASAGAGLFGVLKSFGGRRRGVSGDVLQSPPSVARAPAPAPPPIAEAAALAVRFARLRGPLAAAAAARALDVRLVVDVFSPPGPGASDSRGATSNSHHVSTKPALPARVVAGRGDERADRPYIVGGAGCSPVCGCRVR